MTTALLIAIYLSYVALGLPDTLLGAAWPMMRAGLDASLDAAGTISLVISLGTVASSLASPWLLRRLGTGKVAFLSIALTTFSLLGFSFSGNLLQLLFLAIPLGLGAGAVDAGLNSFVALHCKPRHMNFLHCFWGVGAMSGPAVIAFWSVRGGGWQAGYRTVAAVQLLLLPILFFSLPLWKRLENSAGDERGSLGPKSMGSLDALGLPGVKTSLAAFFCYCSLELTFGLWASSYLTDCKGLPAGEAALCSSLFYGGIAAGRFLSGVLAEKLSGKAVIRWGQCLCAAGVLPLILPAPLPCTILGLGLFGLGCAPLYPAMLQATPDRFGRRASQAVMGLQTAVAYLGSTVTPPLLGIMARYAGVAVFPWFVLANLALMAGLCERLNRFLPKPAKKG